MEGLLSTGSTPSSLNNASIKVAGEIIYFAQQKVISVQFSDYCASPSHCPRCRHHRRLQDPPASTSCYLPAPPGDRGCHGTSCAPAETGDEEGEGKHEQGQEQELKLKAKTRMRDVPGCLSSRARDNPQEGCCQSSCPHQEF